MTVDAWYLDDDMVTDQRKPHRQDPNAPAGESDLQEVGVLCWSFDTDTYKDDPEFAKVWTLHSYLCVCLFVFSCLCRLLLLGMCVETF